jgi:hypothetical protein
MRRDELLAAATDIIMSTRQEDYGTPQKNFAQIAAGWSIILGCTVQPYEVALCMDWVKTARLINNPTHTDSWVDKAGYTGIGAELVGE